jgi:hypothetical protein
MGAATRKVACRSGRLDSGFGTTGNTDRVGSRKGKTASSSRRDSILERVASRCRSISARRACSRANSSSSFCLVEAIVANEASQTACRGKGTAGHAQAHLAWQPHASAPGVLDSREGWEAEPRRGSVSRLSHSTPPVRPLFATTGCVDLSSCAPKRLNKKHLGAVGRTRRCPRPASRRQVGKTEAGESVRRNGALDPPARDRGHGSLISFSTGSLEGADPRAEHHEDTRDRDS